MSIHLYACNIAALNFEGILHLSPLFKFVAEIQYWYAMDNNDSHGIF
jgi:hypothetical protein